ncbi:hypothetical protein HYALB_00008931 [Hymenoscyphus albidus]|uniref:Uncharacterized protein n=1 Tax=Hymenoscyphus albidus TaxID=595503 RepID=A0A9N9Q557_9HELO|nr:hypothetical protein HYALB_00008931 [Hymenoscyphus albidus]
MSPPPPLPSPPLPHPPTSTLTYLRTQHDVPPKSLLQTRRELTKSALSSKTHTSLEKTRLKHEKNLAEARREEALRPRLVARSRDGVGSWHGRMGMGRGRYMAFLVFQSGFAGMLVLATMMEGRRGRYPGPKAKVMMGQRVLFELVLSILIMVSGLLWGAILCLLSIRGGKTGKDWLGLREVSSLDQIQDEKLGKRDLEAGLAVVGGRYGYGYEEKKRVKIIKICVRDTHRLDHNPPNTLTANKSNLTKKKTTAEKLKISPTSTSHPRSRTNRSITHPSPPTPKVSITPSLLPDPAQKEEFIIPPPPPTASRSRASTQPKTWVYTRDIPLDTLTPEGTVTERRQKTLSLQLGDVSVIDGEREEGDEVFVVGGEDDE